MPFKKSLDVPIIIRRATSLYHQISEKFPNESGVYSTAFFQYGLQVDVMFEPAEGKDSPAIEAWGIYTVKRKNGKGYTSGTFPIFYPEAYKLGIVPRDEAVNVHEQLPVGAHS